MVVVANKVVYAKFAHTTQKLVVENKNESGRSWIRSTGQRAIRGDGHLNCRLTLRIASCRRLNDGLTQRQDWRWRVAGNDKDRESVSDGGREGRLFLGAGP